MNTVGAPHDREGDVDDDDALSAVLDNDDDGAACLVAESLPVLDDESDDGVGNALTAPRDDTGASLMVPDDDDDADKNALSAPLDDDGASLAADEIEVDNGALSALDENAIVLSVYDDDEDADDAETSPAVCESASALVLDAYKDDEESPTPFEETDFDDNGGPANQEQEGMSLESLDSWESLVSDDGSRRSEEICCR